MLIKNRSSSIQEKHTYNDNEISFQEGCDDGNRMMGDGCSEACSVEPGWECLLSRPDVCTRKCGNGRREVENGTYVEECDDGNAISGDGCSGECDTQMDRMSPLFCFPGNLQLKSSAYGCVGNSHIRV
jgi:cysteine-rich repeat protein